MSMSCPTKSLNFLGLYFKTKTLYSFVFSILLMEGFKTDRIVTALLFRSDWFGNLSALKPSPPNISLIIEKSKYTFVYKIIFLKLDFSYAQGFLTVYKKISFLQTQVLLKDSLSDHKINIKLSNIKTLWMNITFQFSYINSVACNLLDIYKELQVYFDIKY